MAAKTEIVLRDLETAASISFMIQETFQVQNTETSADILGIDLISSKSYIHDTKSECPTANKFKL